MAARAVSGGFAVAKRNPEVIREVVAAGRARSIAVVTGFMVFFIIFLDSFHLLA